MEDSHINFNFFAVSMFLSLIVLIFVILAVFFFIRNRKCRNTQAPWGYMDWKCFNANGVETNMSDLVGAGKYGSAVQCTPITDGSINVNGIQTPNTFTKFEYMNKSGEIIVGNPSQEKNLSDPDCDSTGESCPNYEVGDVYWPACHGGNLVI